MTIDAVDKSRASVELSRQAPILIVFALFASGFLYFMERRDSHWMQMMERSDVTADLRIEQCHAVQIESAKAMESFSKALQVHALAFNKVSIRLEAISARKQ